MGAGWYYERDKERCGPFSGEHLKELAARGDILPTDTIWKGGVAEGVAANRVKNLFSTSQADVSPSAGPASATPEVIPPVGTIPLSNDEPAKAGTGLAPVAAYVPSKPQARLEKKGIASALKGADIVSQDGVQARYRMKCVECGTKDSSCRTITIANKTLKAHYFCPKCRKKRVVVVQCRTG